MLKSNIVDLLDRVIVNAHILENMIKDGKTWHAGNKIDGIHTQLELLSKWISEIPEDAKEIPVDKPL